MGSLLKCSKYSLRLRLLSLLLEEELTVAELQGILGMAPPVQNFSQSSVTLSRSLGHSASSRKKCFFTPPCSLQSGSSWKHEWGPYGWPCQL